MSYQLTLTDSELKALAWIADRYQSAAVLYDGMEDASDENIRLTGDYLFYVPEHVAWEYRDALEEEDGNQIVPPCTGGTLAEKLISFLGSIV